MRAFAIAVIAVIAAGCADLPAFEETCGNGVIDPDEDCDNNGPTCDSQCRVTCANTVDCDALPGAYVCGADSICHAPSGVFVQTPAVAFPFVVGQGAVADLDGDRIGDVVGFSDVTIDVRFGDLDADLGTRSTMLLPYSNTSIAIRRFDDATGHSDIVVPTPDGLAAYTAASKQLVSYPFSSAPGASGDCVTLGQTADPVATFELDKHRLAFVARVFATGEARVGVLDVVTGECKSGPLCNLTLPDAQQLAGRLFTDHYETQASPLTSTIAVGFASSMTSEQVCALRFTGTPGNFTFTALTATPLVAEPGPIVLARAQPAAGCPTLFTGGGGGIELYAAAGIPAACSLATLPSALPGFGANVLPTGRIPLVPAIAGAAPDALVVAKGVGFAASGDIYTLAVPTTTLMYHSPRPLFPVTAADLDGDGSIEAVASVLGAGGPQGQPDLDVLYRTAMPVDSFVPYRITTQGVPTNLKLGDFDGNALADIAYTERIGTVERLMVAYGTRDRPLPAVQITAFDQIVGFAKLDLPDSIEPTGQVLDDLVVINLPPTAMPTMTILHGNPQRSMLAYFDPRAMFTATDSSFVAALTGNFDATPGVDVLAFERYTPTAGSEAVRMWLAQGTVGSQRLTGAGQPITTSLVTDCTQAGPLCLTGARFLTWPLGDRDVVIAADAQMRPGRSIVTIDPMGPVTPATDPSTALPSEPFVFAMWGAELMATGQHKLLLSLGGIRGLGGTAKQVLDCTVDMRGTVSSCVEFGGEVPELAGWTCQYAEPGRVAPRGRHDPPPRSAAGSVLALCKKEGDGGRVVRISFGDGSYHAEPVLDHAENYEFLSIGDINGDSLDDVAGIAFDESFTPFVQIHLQCDARDVQCRNTNAGAPL
ncbi:MAG TPA: hypothetical protein VFV99_05350 [Kofleriaceae bacterium]|nr:hypothetical protein [Kofleriaceae bacterium]